MTAPAPSPAEQQQIDRFGIFEAEAREAAVLEEVARAIYESDRDPSEFWTVKWESAYGVADDYRRLAAAAVTAYRAQDGGAEAAVRRVEALADHWDSDDDARYSKNRIARSTAARVLRDAIAGELR